MKTFSPCPNCKRSKWLEKEDAQNFRRRVLHCMEPECGFEVDVRVALTAGRIIRRDAGQDVRAAEPVSGS